MELFLEAAYLGSRTVELHKGLPSLLLVNSTCLLGLVVARDFRLEILRDCLNN